MIKKVIKIYYSKYYYPKNKILVLEKCAKDILRSFGAWPPQGCIRWNQS